MKPSRIPSAGYNEASHFMKTNLLSTYYVLNWLKDPNDGKGRIQDEEDTIFHSLLLSVQVHANTYRSQGESKGKIV